MSIKTIVALTLGCLMALPAQAAREIDETDFGPTYGRMTADTWVGKPLQVVGATLGSVTYALTLPFTAISGDQATAKQKLVTEPWNNLKRCTGCTPIEDRYYKSTYAGEPAVVHYQDATTAQIQNGNSVPVVISQ